METSQPFRSYAGVISIFDQLHNFFVVGFKLLQKYVGIHAAFHVQEVNLRNIDRRNNFKRKISSDSATEDEFMM